MNNTVISLFPGIGLLDKGFENAGYCVLRGPDLLWGGDIRQFTPPPGIAIGVIGGPPCRWFSQASRMNNNPDNAKSNMKKGLEMLSHFQRCVIAADPDWWLMENVARVPNLKIEGYSYQRIDLRASEFGIKQRRLRHFQFGHRDGLVLTVQRQPKIKATESCLMASKRDGRNWQQYCELQGLPPGFLLPGFSRSGKYAAVGNGVPVPMATAVAIGIKNARADVRTCTCSCGRELTGKDEQRAATPNCRKRLQKQRMEAALTAV